MTVPDSGEVLAQTFVENATGERFTVAVAHLKSKVVFAGVGDRIEIWDDEKWTLYKKHIEHQGDQMAQRLGEVGAI